MRRLGQLRSLLARERVVAPPRGGAPGQRARRFAPPLVARTLFVGATELCRPRHAEAHTRAVLERRLDLERSRFLFGWQDLDGHSRAFERAVSVPCADHDRAVAWTAKRQIAARREQSADGNFVEAVWIARSVGRLHFDEEGLTGLDRRWCHDCLSDDWLGGSGIGWADRSNSRFVVEHRISFTGASDGRQHRQDRDGRTAAFVRAQHRLRTHSFGRSALFPSVSIGRPPAALPVIDERDHVLLGASLFRNLGDKG